jgi:hypothetical protein
MSGLPSARTCATARGMTWNDRFLELFDRCAIAYRSGNTDFESYYSDTDRKFLAEIGCRSREFFDFVEDFCGEGEPTVSTALMVAAVRRDYFLAVQKGAPDGGTPLTRDEVPIFAEELDGIAYLPRIIAKARAKLRGGLDPDLMYGCGGDRNFLHKNGDIHPADFLRRVWAAGEDDLKISAWVKEQAFSAAGS